MAKGIQFFFSFYSEEILQFFDSEKYFHTEWTDMKKGNESSDLRHKQIQEKLLQMYSDVEDLEAQLSNTSLAKMVILNDLKRISFLEKGLFSI